MNFFWLLSEYLRMHSCRTVLEDRSTVPSVSALLGTSKLRDEPANALLGHLKEKYFNWGRKPSCDSAHTCHRNGLQILCPQALRDKQITYWIIFFLGFVHTLALQADPPFPTWCSLHGRQLLGETHHLALAHHGAPEAGADVHAGAHGVLGPKSQVALLRGIVRLSGEFFRAQDLLAG